MIFVVFELLQSRRIDLINRWTSAPIMLTAFKPSVKGLTCTDWFWVNANIYSNQIKLKDKAKHFFPDLNPTYSRRDTAVFDQKIHKDNVLEGGKTPGKLRSINFKY